MLTLCLTGWSLVDLSSPWLCVLRDGLWSIFLLPGSVSYGVVFGRSFFSLALCLTGWSLVDLSSPWLCVLRDGLWSIFLLLGSVSYGVVFG